LGTAIYARAVARPLDQAARPPGRPTLGEYATRTKAETGSSSIPLSNALRPLLSPAARLLAKQVATVAVSPRTQRRARSITSRLPLRLHLGSGGNNLLGWVNVDLVGARADLAWDLRRPLPFPPESAHAAFLEHVFEHMTLSEALRVLGHVRKVLAPRGVLRVGVPDAGLYARSYAENDDRIEQLRPQRPTRMLALAEVFQQHGHRSGWDGETLCLAMAEAGFSGAAVTPTSASRLVPVPDSPARIAETVYVEAVHP
jgi:predicted SAM-dependent methyltransferase